jgi:hypothetical protein
MNPEEQIKALAELDGYVMELSTPNGVPVMCLYKNKKLMRECSLDSPRMTAYLTSYDAIIPLIQKQSYGIVANIHDILCTTNDTKYFLRNCSPTQLCEALLRATENWKE